MSTGTGISARPVGTSLLTITGAIDLILDNFAKSLDAIVGEGGVSGAIDIVNPQLLVFGLELVGQLP